MDALAGCYAFLVNPTAAELRARPAAPPRPSPRGSRSPMFAAENVIDGYARAIRGVPHSWRPDPRQPWPQWVELDFGKTVAFNTVHVSFQSKEMRAEDFRIEVSEAARGRAWPKEPEPRPPLRALHEAGAGVQAPLGDHQGQERHGRV